MSILQLNRSVLTAIAPEAQQDLADRIFQRRHLAQGQRIVVIGGGTGLSTMLRGLKEHTSNIAAIVTVTDNGGSSGRLTQQMGVLPAGRSAKLPGRPRRRRADPGPPVPVPLRRRA